MAEMKWELEDFSFRFTEPELYRKIGQPVIIQGLMAPGKDLKASVPIQVSQVK